MFEDLISNFDNIFKSHNFGGLENENDNNDISDNLYISELKKTMNKYNYDLNKNKKILIIIASHINGKDKFITINNNIQYFKEYDILIHNSKDLLMNEEIKNYYNDKNIKYEESENNIYLDFGKWYKSLKNIDYEKYDFIVFTNDSIYLKNSINYFFNLMIEKNVELYAYNDSKAINNHYQSYLFGIKKSAIYKFINFFEERKKIIDLEGELIRNTEVKLAEYFDSKDCFLHLSKLNVKDNIYFYDDKMYQKLYINNLLPFIKLKKLIYFFFGKIKL